MMLGEQSKGSRISGLWFSADVIASAISYISPSYKSLLNSHLTSDIGADIAKSITEYNHTAKTLRILSTKLLQKGVDPNGLNGY